jgi:hypothetical protein
MDIHLKFYAAILNSIKFSSSIFHETLFKPTTLKNKMRDDEKHYLCFEKDIKAVKQRILLPHKKQNVQVCDATQAQ